LTFRNQLVTIKGKNPRWQDLREVIPIPNKSVALQKIDKETRKEGIQDEAEGKIPLMRSTLRRRAKDKRRGNFFLVFFLSWLPVPPGFLISLVPILTSYSSTVSVCDIISQKWYYLRMAQEMGKDCERES